MIKTKIFMFNLLSATVASPLALAQHGMPGGTPMTFFVTSKPIGDGGNLGGLAGADTHCQALAENVGVGDRIWQAYLSTQARPGAPAVNARDRIGTGPWHNFEGVMIARDVAHLHGDMIELARLGNNLTKRTGLTEKGQIVPGLNDYNDIEVAARAAATARDNEWDYANSTPYSNRHEVLTGSQLNGRAYPPDQDYTCNNWTSNQDPDFEQSGRRMGAFSGKPNVQIGFPDRNGGGDGSWNSSHGTRGCSQTALAMTHGVGMYYCFAIN